MKFSHICLGGTFDHLHEGHKAIIDHAFAYGHTVSIGLTKSHDLLDKKFRTAIEPYSIRSKHLSSYLKTKGYLSRSIIFPLTDMYGTAADDSTLEAIVVTQETKANALMINKKRKKNGLRPLKILTIDLVKGTDKKVIRSTRIRKGLIDRSGEAYLELFTNRNILYLPSSLRASLRKPFGKLIKGTDKEKAKVTTGLLDMIKSHTHPMIITVGDIVSQSLTDHDIIPDLSVIDHKTQRERTITHPGIKQEQPLENKPGTIRKKTVVILYGVIQKVLNKRNRDRAVLHIKGEEDLLALPAILFAPLGSLVIYGQRDLGVIVVSVTEEIKDRVEAIVKKFV